MDVDDQKVNSPLPIAQPPRPATYRCTHKVEAMQWIDTDAHREAFATWFAAHDVLFETRGAQITLPDDCGTAEVGEWLLWMDGEFVVMDDECFRASYEACP